LFAALTIVTLPMIILYLSAQKQFISGLAAGAVKG
jgi:raffinose/stachyose/melibiose transport system permease protein